jgi:CRP/FNR family cyclic AMP-dependent transcriptional regulator
MAHEEFIARVPIFSGCTPEQVAAIAAVTQESFYEPGQIVVTEGTPGQAFYLVMEGKVEYLRDGSVLGTFSPGEFFGEMSLLDEAPRSATVRAVEQTRCLMLSSWDFKALLLEHPEIAIKLLEVLSRRIRVSNERVGL